jgi:hypothetical protein
MSGAKKRVLAMVALGAVLLRSGPADAGDPTIAQQLFERGRSAMVAGDYRLAHSQFEASYQQEPALGTLLNLAVCEERLGVWIAAVRHLGQGLQMSLAGDPRQPSIAARFAELGARIPRLTLRSRAPLPAGVTITFDGAAIDPAIFGTPLPVDPGSHSIRCIGAHAAVCTHEVETVEGQSIEWLIELESGPIASQHVAQQDATHVASTTHMPVGHRNSALPLWIGAASLASIALGLAAGAEVLNLKSTMASHCDATHCDSQGVAAASSGPVWSWVSTLAVGAGVVGLGTSVTIALAAQASRVASAELAIQGSF